MKKICKITSLVLVILSLLNSVAFADISISPVDYDGKHITISGQSDEEDGKVVTLTMIKRDENSIDTPLGKEIYEMTEAELKNVYVKQTSLLNGEFLFKFSPVFANGIYDIYVNVEGVSGKANTKVYSYFNIDFLNNLLALINDGKAENVGDGTDKDAYKAIQDNLKTVFVGVSDIYLNQDVSIQKEIVKAICSLSGFENLDAVTVEINRLAILSKIYALDDAVNTVLNNESNLGLSGKPAFLVFSGEEDTFKTSVTDRLKGTSLDKDFVKVFSEAVYLEKIHQAKNTDEIYKIMENIRDNTEIDVSKYFSFSRKSEIDAALVGKKWDADTLTNKIDYVINNTSYPAGGGSGGSKGGGGSISVGTIVATVAGNSSQDTQNKPKLSFSDVPESHWGYKPVNTLYSRGVIQGDGEGKFYPERMVTRAEFAKMVSEMFSITDENAKSAFSDVSEADWYYLYVSSLSSNKIISGKTENEFVPNDYITREEAIQILYRIVVQKNSVIEKKREIIKFADTSDISDYALVGIMALYAGNILNGYEDETIKPKNKITRAESAQLIVNLYSNMR